MKLELDWHFTKDEMPEIPEGQRDIWLFIASESGAYYNVSYSKYGFNTTDWDGTEFELPEKEKGKTAIPTRAWAYIPEEWNDIFFPEEKETKDETV